MMGRVINVLLELLCRVDWKDMVLHVFRVCDAFKRVDNRAHIVGVAIF